MSEIVQRPRRLRWWPAATVLVLAAIALAWIWLTPAESRQTRVMLSIMVALATAVLMVLWLLLASGLRARQRLLIFAAVIGLAAFLALSLEVREFSGDVVPRFAFKWTPRPDEGLTSNIAPGAGRDRAGRDRADTETSEIDASFPQFLGPNRNATIDGVRLATQWQTLPPELLWRQPVGAGNGGFVIAGDLAITQEQRGEHEMVVAYRLLSGDSVWSHRVETRHQNPLSGDGPCATPSIADGQVFAVGATGRLSALDLASGAEIWSRDILEDAGAGKPPYGLCASPLIPPQALADNIVIVSTGGRGALRAYDRTTGELRWSGGEYSAAYASPAVITVADTPQIVVFHGGGPHGDITGHDLEGHPLWHRPWPPVERTSQPVALPEDRILISSGYGAGAEVFRVTRDGTSFATETLWAAKSIKAKLTQVVHHDGFLYGLDDGIMVAVDAETGKRAWKRGRYGHGQILLVDDVILVLSEKGEIALVEASPEEYHEWARIPGIEGRTWNTPALAGPYLIIRSPREAAAFELPLRTR